MYMFLGGLRSVTGLSVLLIAVYFRVSEYYSGINASFSLFHLPLGWPVYELPSYREEYD